MADVINAVSGNKMFQLKQGIKELRERLKVEEDPDVIAGIKKKLWKLEPITIFGRPLKCRTAVSDCLKICFEKRLPLRKTAGVF